MLTKSVGGVIPDGRVTRAPDLAATMKIGVISDTHNHLDPLVTKLFEGVTHILHAGDIGAPAILHRLEEVAPVTAVCGNTDDLAFRYPQTEVIELARRKFLVHHIVNPHAPDETVQRWLQRLRPDVLVFGHTHKPFCQQIGRTLFFNPGYAGKPRFALERSVAIIHLEDGHLKTEYFPLV